MKKTNVAAALSESEVVGHHCSVVLTDEVFKRWAAQAPDPMLVLGSDGAVFYANKAAEKLFKSDDSNTPPASIEALASEHLSQSVQKDLELLFQTGGTRLSEVCFTSSEGDAWVESNLTSVGPAGEPVRMAFWTLRDITAQKHAERERLRNEARFKELHALAELKRRELELTAIYDSTPVPMLLLDSKGLVRKINRAASMLCHLPIEQISGETIGRVLGCCETWNAPDRCGTSRSCGFCGLRSAVNETLSTGKACRQRESTHVLHRGPEPVTRHFLASISPVQISNDACVLIALEDITRITETESSLRDQRQFVSQITALMPDLLYVFDLDCRESVFVNRDIAAAGLPDPSGAPDKESTIYRRLHPEDSPGLDAHLARMRNLPDGEVAEFEYRIRASVDQWRWLRSRDTVFKRTPQGKVRSIIGIGQDITGAKKAEAERALLETQLRQAQKMEAIGTLAGGIAHDFNNILGVIFGFTQLAMADLPENSGALASLKEIMQAAGRARELIQQILLFSRRQAAERHPTLVQPLVNEALKLLRATIPTSIDLRARLEAPDAMIVCDPSNIHQILMNLCNNAVQAIGGGVGFVQVELLAQRIEADGVASWPGLIPGQYVCLRVIDNGCGISPDAIDRVFEPFFTTKPPGQGTGLGLSVVHGIVKSCRGSVRVRSELGQGATFEIQFPRVTRARPALPTVQVLPVKASGERILLVDDETALAMALKFALGRIGYKVTTSGNGADALELFKKAPNEFDVVITDQTMPRMTGTTLAQNLKSLRPNLPVILITGNNAMSEQQALTSGIDMLLAKPMTIERLSEAVGTMIQKYKS